MNPANDRAATYLSKLSGRKKRELLSARRLTSTITDVRGKARAKTEERSLSFIRQQGERAGSDYIGSFGTTLTENIRGLGTTFVENETTLSENRPGTSQFEQAKGCGPIACRRIRTLSGRHQEEVKQQQCERWWMNIVAVTLALEIALHGPPTEDARPCSGALMRVNDSFPSFVRPRVHNVDVKDVNTIWLKGSLIAWL